jgi:4-carboxymuconolactone decarboxylase
MSRIEPVDPPFSEALQQRMARLVPPGMPPPQIFRIVARNEGLFLHLVDSGLLGPTGLLERNVLPARLRELVILRTCAAAHNDYEWRLHVHTISARMGLSDAQIDDTLAATPNAAWWSEAELAAMELIDSLVPGLHVGDALFERVRLHFDEPTLIEITQLVGLYTGVAMLVALAKPALDGYARPKAESVKQADRPDSVRAVARP